MNDTNTNWCLDFKVREKAKNIKRPPFDFDTSEVLDEYINELIDVIQDNDAEPDLKEAKVSILEEMIFCMTRELREGSPEERWVIDYYCNGGWIDE